jgi:hypothetical protein
MIRLPRIIVLACHSAIRIEGDRSGDDLAVPIVAHDAPLTWPKDWNRSMRLIAARTEAFEVCTDQFARMPNPSESTIFAFPSLP